MATEQELRRALADAMAEYRRGGRKHTIKALAAKAGVHPATMSRLIYKETRRPAFKTMHGALTALGYELHLRKRR